MAHVRTKDPFGFVGAHVVFSGPPQQAALIAGGGGGATLFDDAPPAHAWVTRYDARLDCYSLFAPGRRAARVISRGNMMKLVADPSFEVRRGDDLKHATDSDEWPPPIEDATSRYVGVPIVKAGDAAVKGSVTCFLPFADVYRAVFDDGSSDEVSEDAIIESMIHLLTTAAAAGTPTATAGTTTRGATGTTAAAASREESSRKRKRTPSVAGASPVSLLPPATVRSVSAPVVSVAVPPPSMMPVSYAAVLGMDSSPVVTHSNILELAAARNRSSGFGGTGFTPIAQADRPAAAAAVTPMPTPRQPAAAPTPLAPVTSFVKSEPTTSSSNNSSSATNIIMLIDDEPDVEMIPLDVNEEVEVPVVTAASGNDPWAAPASAQPQPFYLVTKGEHQQVAPLETRNVAYKYVREELLNLLDTQEAGAKKIAMQYDILRNPDIKHISSIKRFTEASGLIVLNHLLATYLAEHEEGTRDADVLLLLKLVAMLPIPARKHVADSKIALTIGKLARPRSLEMYPKLPVCVTHLAKWIKRKWTEHFSKLENQEKDVSRLRGAPQAPKSGHPSHRLATRTSPQPSGNASSQRNSDRLVDTTPIPRLASRPALSNPTDASSTRPTTDVMGNPIAARARVGLPLTSGGASSGRKSSLKPDWMRQQETLRRTRFTSEGGQDSAAEFNHYKRVRESSTSAGGAQSSAGGSGGSRQVSGTSSYSTPDNEQLESAGGVRGTYGRKQTLSFGARWNVVEFLRDAPPNSIRPASGGSRASSYHRPQSQRQQGRPRSILRRESRYQGSLDLFR